MKKRILTLVAALALAATVFTPVEAAKETPAQKTNYTSQTLQNESKNVTDKTIVDALVGAATNVKMSNNDLKPSGAADAKVNVVTGSAKDNLMDNGIKPVVKEFVKASKEHKSDNGEKAGVDKLRGIHYFDLTASQTGDVTFKIDDDMNQDAMSGDCYAIITHYTGNAADEDGITAQYCKISSAGKVTAHFNSFSPVAVIATTSESAQQLVNTYSHSAGSDAGAGTGAVTTTTPATVPTPAPADANAANAANAADAAGAAAAAGKGAASPKTSDNAYALYLILAVAAVAGTTLVATKKTR